MISIALIAAPAALAPPPPNRRQRRAHLQPPGTPPPPPARPATSLAPAVLAGVAEDHAHEQFFFDEPTRAALLRLLSRHERPLLLCAPSLAVAAEAAGAPYLLLDRDDRFAFLPHFRRFDLDAPSAVDGYAYDAVLCDPPFANFDLGRLRRVLEVLAGGDPLRAASPLYLCHNERREAALRDAFAGSGRQLARLAPVGYSSVKESTQRSIRLYGPPPAQQRPGDQGAEAAAVGARERRGRDVST